MPKPSVLIVGAGPGDPLLISVLGLRYLKMADVVVHDHLVHQRLLNMARNDAEIIDAGAAALQESLEQDAISFLLADKAREGKLVVRLNGVILMSLIVAQKKQCFYTSKVSHSKWYRESQRQLESHVTPACL